MPFSTEVGLGPDDILLDGDHQKGRGHSTPNFGPCPFWTNGWMDQDKTWHGDRPRHRPHCARWRPSSPSLKVHSSLQFLAHVCCGQTAGWIKLPLGREVYLGLGDIVLDGAQPSFPKEHSTHTFRPMSTVAKRLDGSKCHLVSWR